MNMPIKQLLPITILPVLTIVLAACNPTPVATTKPERVALTSIDAMTAKAGKMALLKDEPANVDYEELSKLFAAGRQGGLHLKVYRLAAPPADPQSYLRSRAEQLGMKDSRMIYPNDNVAPSVSLSKASEVRTVGMRSKQFELALNLDSGSESFVDNERFHNTPGVPPEESKADAFYVENAQRYMKAQIPVGKTALYPYKIRHYMDAVAKGGMKPKVTTAQIAIAFNADIDGIPVIGPGDKVVVHMTPAGEVLAHESTVLATAQPLAEVSGDELLDPRRANAEAVKRIKERGINLDDYTLTRTEFGYFRLGRDSVQKILAPYYAYVYEPRSEKVLGRKIFEIVPAVSEPKIARLVSDDLMLDQARKARIIEKAGKPDVRRNR